MVHPHHGRKRVKPLLITIGAALLVTVPATMGLVGNTSFARSVPVRVPAHATVVNEQNGQAPTTPTEKPKPARHIEPRDDHGGRRPAAESKRGEQSKGRQTGPNSGRGGPSQHHKGQNGTPAANSGSAESAGPSSGSGSGTNKLSSSGSGKGDNGSSGRNGVKTGGSNDSSGHG
jgi:hypothetical protein